MPKWDYGEVLHLHTAEESSEDLPTEDNSLSLANISQVFATVIGQSCFE